VKYFIKTLRFKIFQLEDFIVSLLITTRRYTNPCLPFIPFTMHTTCIYGPRYSAAR